MKGNYFFKVFFMINEVLLSTGVKLNVLLCLISETSVKRIENRVLDRTFEFRKTRSSNFFGQ